MCGFHSFRGCMEEPRQPSPFARRFSTCESHSARLNRIFTCASGQRESRREGRLGDHSLHPSHRGHCRSLTVCLLLGPEMVGDRLAGAPAGTNEHSGWLLGFGRALYPVLVSSPYLFPGTHMHSWLYIRVLPRHPLASHHTYSSRSRRARPSNAASLVPSHAKETSNNAYTWWGLPHELEP